MKTVLVTGGTGLVGRFITDELHARGWQVTIAGRNAPPSGLFPADIGFCPLDLHPSTDYRAATRGFDALVHAGFSHRAGRYRGGEGEDVRGFWDRNFLSSLQLFEAAKETGIERAVFLSSRAVYGRQPPGAPLTEETRCHPDTHYGLIKLACEQHLEGIARQTGLCGSSLRVTGVYGLSGATNKWKGLIEDYLAGRPVTPRVATEVHGRDVAAAVRTMLEAPPDAVSGAVFNVSDLTIDRRDILSPVRDRFGCEHPLPARGDPATLNVMDTSRLSGIGWRAGGRPLFDRSMADILTDQSLSS